MYQSVKSVPVWINSFKTNIITIKVLGLNVSKTQGCHYKLAAGGNLPVVGLVCAGYFVGNVSQILESFERKLSFHTPTSCKKHFYVV